MGLRTWLAGKLSDAGIGVLGAQLDRLETRLEQQIIEIESFRERFQRLSNRLQMRHARAARGGERSDEQIIEELKSVRGRPDDDQGDIFGDGFRH